MQRIVYYVALSIDGFIAGPNEDISQFLLEGPGVERYQADLANYKTVIMGRKTYEFGYRFGLPPGQPAYPGMEHHIFSDSLQFENPAPTVHVEPRSLDRVRAIQSAATTDVYLCGGGAFAGWLLKNEMIDQLKIKLNPIVLGDGIRLFGDVTASQQWSLETSESFSDGMVLLTYNRA